MAQEIKINELEINRFFNVAQAIISNLSPNNQNFILAALKRLHADDIRRIETSEHKRVDWAEINSQLDENKALIQIIEKAYNEERGIKK